LRNEVSVPLRDGFG